MMNQIMNLLMGQLQMRNPQALKQYQDLRKNNGDPKRMLQQLTGNYTPEQQKQFTQFLGRFGITNDQLTQHGIDSK